MPRYRVTLKKNEWESEAETVEATGDLFFDHEFVSVCADENESFTTVLAVPTARVNFVKQVQPNEYTLDYFRNLGTAKEIFEAVNRIVKGAGF